MGSPEPRETEVPYLNLPVKGACPICDASMLTLSRAGDIVCTNRQCDDPRAITTLLTTSSPAHIVKLTHTGYRVMHPLIERLDETLFDCELDKHMAVQIAPPQASGLYAVHHESGEWHWSRIND